MITFLIEKYRFWYWVLSAGCRLPHQAHPEHSTQHPEFINLMFPVAITVKQNLTIIKNPQKEFSTLLAIFKCEMQQMHATKNPH